MIFWRSFNFLCLAFMAIFPLAACNAQSAEPETYVYYPLVIHSDDSALMFQVELAETPEAQAQGLMYRKNLDADKGMLFVFPKSSEHSFWMRNTLIPLDLLFIYENGEIAHIHKMAMPLDETPLPSKYKVKAVLEIAGGEATRQGIKIGQRIETKLLEQE